MKYQWQFCTDEENPEGYYQKLVNMNTPEGLSLEEAAERLNELEREVDILRTYMNRDTKAMADEHLAKIKKQKKAREYLSQGYTPTETGMALNMSLDEVLKAKEQE